MAVVNVDVRDKITEAIINLKTVKHTKPTAKKIFSYLRKSDEELELVVLQSYLEKLVEDKYLQTKGSNDNETFTIARKRHTSECEETITEYVEAEQTLDEPKEKLTNETRHDIKKLENYSDSMADQQDQQQHPVLLGKTNAAKVNQYYFYERMVSQLQSEV